MFVIEVPYFNLDQIYNSKQVPRWIKLKESKYVIPFRNKALKIEQQKERLIMSCTEEEFYNIWYKYFDLQTDYFALNNKIKKLKKFKVLANRGSGIHIINQDIFETYVFTKIVKDVGYDKAKVAVNHIAEVCGIKHVQSMREAGRVTWYEWPTPEMILENFDNLKKMGKINNWLKDECDAIISLGLVPNNNELFKLFAQHMVSVFPTYGIEDTLRKNFDCEPEEFADWYLDEIENKGLAYMYILHHITNRPKEIVPNGIG